ncbi:MAG: transglutaminase-like cysteine peptidase [Motiliproteus sp.]
MPLLKAPLLKVPALLLSLLLIDAASATRFGLNERMLTQVEQQYGSEARDRLSAWQQLTDNYQGDNEWQKINRVNRFFNQVRFLDDLDHWQKSDYWATPVEFLATNGGDCEDFSIAKYFTLKELGIPTAKLRLMYVKALELNQAHMVVTYYETPESEPLILDNLITKIEPASRRTDLKPVYSFNAEGLWNAKERGRGVLIGRPDQLRLWTDLSQRMQNQLEGRITDG